MRKFITFFFFFVVMAAAGQKQRQARMDSLLSELPRVTDDATKLSLYIDIINTYNEFNQDQALPYEQLAMTLARNLKSKKREADIKNAIGRVYWRKGLFDLARSYHNQAKKIFEEEKDQMAIALCTRYLGQDFADEGNYPEALKHFEIALRMYTNMGDQKRMAYIHSLNQWVYGRQGNFTEAFKSGYTALKLSEQIGDKNNVAIVLSDLGENFMYVGDYLAALKYFMKGTEVYRAKGDSINVAYNYNLIGITYRDLGDYTRSLKNHLAALKIGKSVNDANIISNSYDGIGDVHNVHRDYSKALTNYLAAVEGFKRWSNKRDLARVYCKIGECNRILGQNAVAKKYFDDAFALSKDVGSKILIADYYRGVEHLDSVTKNWKGAYFNHKKYVSVKDSIFDQDNARKMAQMDLVREFDKKETTAKAERERKDFEQRIESIALAIISLLIFLLALVLYRNQKRIARINKELKVKSEKLEEENREKTSILNIVSHDLKAPFNKIKGLTDLLAMSQNMPKEISEEYIAHIRSSIDQGTYLIRNLLEGQNMDNESSKPHFEQIDIPLFIHNFQVDLNGQLLKKQQELQVSIETEKSVLITDKQMLTRILDNLLSNASKFSEKEKSIYLRVWSEKGNVNFSVRDEGPGISDDDQRMMFKKFQTLSARPTAGEGSTGLGLSIAKVLVDKLNGSIHITSKVGRGTEFVISLPDRV